MPLLKLENLRTILTRDTIQFSLEAFGGIYIRVWTLKSKDDDIVRLILNTIINRRMHPKILSLRYKKKQNLKLWIGESIFPDWLTIFYITYWTSRGGLLNLTTRFLGYWTELPGRTVIESKYISRSLWNFPPSPWAYLLLSISDACTRILGTEIISSMHEKLSFLDAVRITLCGWCAFPTHNRFWHRNIQISHWVYSTRAYVVNKSSITHIHFERWNV